MNYTYQYFVISIPNNKMVKNGEEFKIVLLVKDKLSIFASALGMIDITL